MAEIVNKVKGFINRNGDKFELKPSAHTHTCDEIEGLEDKMIKQPNAEENHIAIFNDEGQVVDSDHTIDEFATSSHSHEEIHLWEDNGQGGSITVDNQSQGDPAIVF